MELSIFAARILAVIYISIGISIVSGGLNLAKLIEDFSKSTALSFMTGFMVVIVAGILLQYHHDWPTDWTILVTIIGWVALIKGLFLLTFPKSILYFKGMVKNGQPWGFALILIGLLFGYFGFII